jgi:hypothetical protein
MTPLERSMVQTVAYFDLFDFPLTYPELYRYLWRAPQTSLSEVITTATQLPSLVSTGGFVMFAKREGLATTRQSRYIESELKWNKRRWFIQWLSYLPGVQAIFLVNTLAYHNVQSDSDIDLLIVAQPKKIWAVRFYTTLLAKLFGVRPKPGRTKDAVCLSFYATPTGLTQLAQLRSSDDDVLEAYWLAQALPLYDPHHYAAQLIHNPWIKTVLPNTVPQTTHFNRQIHVTWLHQVMQAFGQLWLWNSLLKQLQLWFMPARLKQLSGPLETAVVVLSNDVMKFHTYDPRPQLMQRWRERVEHYSR